ncbi:hypothetical protein [Taklimakanibacter deserti]|uniref:hypothetical protein n=1 Tax=Taklimakanibacter deserti TaxID=2267839 RepID=UPI0034D5C788
MPIIPTEPPIRRLSKRFNAVAVVHGGHFPSFGPTRYRQLIDDYLAGLRKAGCHVTAK